MNDFGTSCIRVIGILIMAIGLLVVLLGFYGCSRNPYYSAIPCDHDNCGKQANAYVDAVGWHR